MRSNASLGDIPTYGCRPQGLDAGQRVQATADIAFRPAGLVEEGALGNVVVDGPADTPRDTAVAERVVVVTWDGIPGLMNSRVTRDMIVEVIAIGDVVQATADTEYIAAEGKESPLGDLAVADLVRATQDLGSVPRGTYGTVVAVPREAAGLQEHRNSTRLKLEHGRAMVSFMSHRTEGGAPVENTMRVRVVHVCKAPQVGERVRAKENLEAGKGKQVSKGSIGVVSDVQASEETLQFHFAVDWRDGGHSNSTGEQLEALYGSEGAIVPRGTQGKVLSVQATAEKGSQGAAYVVGWKGFPGQGALVRGNSLKKVEHWSTRKARWCCATEGVGCSETSGHEHHDCTLGDPQAWALAKALWCCEHEALGCKSRDNKKEAPQLARVAVDFDPAPHSGVTG